MMPVRVRPHLAEILDNTRHVVVMFSVLGDLLPDPAAVAQQVREMLQEFGHEMSILVGASDNPFDVMAEAYQVSEEVGRRAEQLIHDAEVDAAGWVPVTTGTVELLEACRATGRSVAVYAPHSESAVGRHLHRLGLRDLAGPVMGRGFATRNVARAAARPGFATRDSVQAAARPGFAARESVQAAARPGFPTRDSVQVEAAAPELGGRELTQAAAGSGFGGRDSAQAAAGVAAPEFAGWESAQAAAEPGFGGREPVHGAAARLGAAAWESVELTAGRRFVVRESAEVVAGRGVVVPELAESVVGVGGPTRGVAGRTLGPVFDALGVRAEETAVVCATFSAMSAAQWAGAHAIGVEWVREPRKVLHGGEGRNAVVRSLAALAGALRECGLPSEML
ncbi:hypothetical protein [Dactylosporangium sp. NPDC051541]|uniref:hypothetical protein n=1 Tax=Dactylosporangium sp. NPDC051541 TaxID=3363977 RepID=UPI0037B53C66